MTEHTPLPPITEDEPLARHTSWRVGGPARYYAEARTPAEAAALARWAVEHTLPLFWLGGGTNLLARDAGFPGLVARYRAQSWRIDEQGDTARLYVEAGAPMAGTARRVSAMGWAGLEWAEGVPGTVGGAVFGNAGCYGGDIAGILQSATLLVGETIEEWPLERMGYGYRTSFLKAEGGRRKDEPGGIASTSSLSDVEGVMRKDEPGGIASTSSFILQPSAFSPLILAATLGLTQGDPAELAERMRRIAAERKGKTPWGSSCGSVFKNPPGESAGRLIEQAGLKGRRVGGAEISERHANYIVNLGGASSDDLLALITLAREEVRRRFGVELELEVRIL